MGPPAGFNVRVQVLGELGPTWSAMFADLSAEPGAGGTTLISGEIPDQAALHGLLAAIRDLGLSLLSVETLVPPNPGAQRGGR
jgi:hypothetical protein